MTATRQVDINGKPYFLCRFATQTVVSAGAKVVSVPGVGVIRFFPMGLN